MGIDISIFGTTINNLSRIKKKNQKNLINRHNIKLLQHAKKLVSVGHIITSENFVNSTVMKIITPRG